MREENAIVIVDVNEFNDCYIILKVLIYNSFLFSPFIVFLSDFLF